ncbi:MAG: serine--tRNA ligase, partial [Paludibacteraceae bacterium]|nr:serine--tRNA ligase [Paludibacteraceae bacterium]
MLTLQQINNDKEKVILGLEKKHFADARQTIEKVLILDKERRDAQQKKDDASAQINKISKSIGELMAQKKLDEAQQAKAQTATIKQEIAQFEALMETAETNLRELLYTIPNVPYDAVPEGTNAEDNVVVKLANTRGSDGKWKTVELN